MCFPPTLRIEPRKGGHESVDHCAHCGVHCWLHGVDGQSGREFQFEGGGAHNSGAGDCLESRRKQHEPVVERMALGGYNSKLIENANASRDYGSNVLAESQSVISDTQQGTLIEQAGAQNALLYQQTALLDKMKNDVNDATVAEAAHREQQLQAERNAAVIRRAMSNIPVD